MRSCLNSNKSKQCQQENAFALLLRQCRDIQSAKRLHSNIHRSGLLESSTYLGNLLIQMYGNCSSLIDARTVFHSITTRNVFSWNILLAAYTHNRLFQEAIRLFLDMDLEGEAQPNDFTYATVLGACSARSDLAAGACIHESVIDHRLESNNFVGTALITMYANCGRLDRARQSFRSILGRDLVAWNAMITAFVHEGDSGSSQAIEIFREMNHEGVEPDSFTFLGLISACANLENLALGAAFHERVLASGLEERESVQNALVNLYAKCGSVLKAHEVFDRIPDKDVFAWTAMISAYAQAPGKSREAMNLFLEMDLHGVQPEAPTFAILTSIISSLQQARTIHRCVSESGLESDIVVGTSLINMYADLSSLDDVKGAFDELAVRDVVAWNAILDAAASENPQLARLWYHEMDLEGMKSNAQTFRSRIEAFSRHGDVASGRSIHRRLVSCGFVSDEILTCLVGMYSKCGCLDEAMVCFEALRERNVVAWTAAISAFAQNGCLRCGLELFQLMEAEGVEPDISAFASAIPSCWKLEDLREMHARVSGLVLRDSDKLVVGTALVSMYASLGSLDDAIQVFNCIPCCDSVAFNAMSTAYVENERYYEAIELFLEMEDHNNVQPTLVTIINAINSCTCLGELEEGRRIHDKLEDAYEVLYPVVVAALVNMYGRCGSLKSVRALFDGQQKRTVMSWNSMVAAYAQHGHVQESVDCFREMQVDGLLPDKFTYTSLLQACSHAGMVCEGKSWFARMGVDHGLIPVIEHYVCMVDLFGRVGQLDSAEAVVCGLPFEPDAAVWNSLLGACKLQGDMMRAERSAELALRFGVEYAAPYVLLANLYAGAGRWEDVAAVRKLMADRGIRKPSGKSFQCI